MHAKKNIISSSSSISLEMLFSLFYFFVDNILIIYALTGGNGKIVLNYPKEKTTIQNKLNSKNVFRNFLINKF